MTGGMHASTAPAPTVPRRVLEIGGYPPPRGGWTMRIEWLKRQLEADGHECVVLNIGANRLVPSPHYETVSGGLDYIRKVWRFSRRGFLAHTHVNGESPKGLLLALVAQVLSRAAGSRSVVTFHAGIDQSLFPRAKAPLLSPLFSMVFRIAQRVVCNSPAVKTRILEYGVCEEKVIPIPAFTRQYLEFTPPELPADVEALFRRYPQVVFTYTRILPAYYPEVLFDGFARVAGQRPGVGLLVLGVSEDRDAALWERVQQRIRGDGLSSRTCFVASDDHDTFLTLMTRSAIYLRTHVADGVASSVLEALSLGVPVVACENGTRPPGVITFPPESASELASRVIDALDRRQEIAGGLTRPEIRDTLAEEVALLTAL
jgi:glycosyltransferase involved in cell wall biosynthesis